jgi:hypothetical protein
MTLILPRWARAPWETACTGRTERPRRRASQSPAGKGPTVRRARGDGARPSARSSGLWRCPVHTGWRANGKSSQARSSCVGAPPHLPPSPVALKSPTTHIPRGERWLVCIGGRWVVYIGRSHLADNRRMRLVKHGAVNDGPGRDIPTSQMMRKPPARKREPCLFRNQGLFITLPGPLAGQRDMC